MYFNKFEIIPNVGIGNIKIGMKFNDVIKILKDNKIIYSTGVDPNKGCNPEVEWVTIFIKKYMNLRFAKDILWQINFEEEFKGRLVNGISIGTKIDDALKIDKVLEFDDWNEIYYSKVGYWLIDSLDTKKIIEISIGIPEILDDDKFDSYEWVKRYE